MTDKTQNPAEIYLVPVFDGEHDHVWCDTPAPGEGMREEDATRYVREDIYLATLAQVKQLRGNEIEVAADAYWKGYVAGGDDFRSRINIPLEVVTKKANALIVKLYPESESANKIRQQAKGGE